MPRNRLSRTEAWKWWFVIALGAIMLLTGALSPFSTDPMNPLLAGALGLMGIVFAATGLVKLFGVPKRLGSVARRRIIAVAGLVFGLAGLLLALVALIDPEAGLPQRHPRGFVVSAGLIAAGFMGTAGIFGLLSKKPK